LAGAGAIREEQGHTQKGIADLIAVGRYGEKETNSAQFPRRVAHQSRVCGTGLPQSDEPPEWLSQVCSAMAREVREALEPLTNSRPGATGSNFLSNGARITGFGRDSLELPTCYRGGQKGHVLRGCRNLLFPDFGNY